MRKPTSKTCSLDVWVLYTQRKTRENWIDSELYLILLVDLTVFYDTEVMCADTTRAYSTVNIACSDHSEL